MFRISVVRRTNSYGVRITIGKWCLEKLFDLKKCSRLSQNYGTRLSVSLANDEIKTDWNVEGTSHYPEREDAGRNRSGHQCPFHDLSGQI